MNCPNDGETLQARERLGVEIDVCPTCRGVWLDRGELDKILERESRYDDRNDRNDRNNRNDDDDDDDGGRGGFFRNIIDAIGGRD